MKGMLNFLEQLLLCVEIILAVQQWQDLKKVALHFDAADNVWQPKNK